MPNSNINYAMWLGDNLAVDDYEDLIETFYDRFGVGAPRNAIGGGTLGVDEDAPANRARETIKDLKAGTVPQSIVRDLGDAVKQATRDSGVGRAIGQDRMVGGLR